MIFDVWNIGDTQNAILQCN
ncbi:hypothetical protein [Sporosarcina sp. P1]